MVQVIIFMLTIFIGWIIFDFVKHKKVTKENVLTAFISGLVAGLVYYVLYWVF